MRGPQILYTMGGSDNLEVACKYFAQAAHVNPRNLRALYGLMAVRGGRAPTALLRPPLMQRPQTVAATAAGTEPAHLCRAAVKLLQHEYALAAAPSALQSALARAAEAMCGMRPSPVAPASVPTGG